MVEHVVDHDVSHQMQAAPLTVDPTSISNGAVAQDLQAGAAAPAAPAPVTHDTVSAFNL